MLMLLIFNRGKHPKTKITTEAMPIRMACGSLQNPGWIMFGDVDSSRVNDKVTDNPKTLKTIILNLDVKLDLTIRIIN